MTSALENLRHKLNSLGKSQDRVTMPSDIRADAAVAQDDHETVLLPRVNLLPKAVRDSIRIAQLIKRAGLAAGALILLTAIIWAAQIPAIDQAQGALDQAQQDNQTLNSQVTALSPIGELYSALTRQQEFVQDTLSSSPRASDAFTRLQDAAEETGKSSVQITSASISYHGIPQRGDVLNPCPNPDLFNESITIGCLSFNATAKSRDQISVFLNNLSADPLFVGAYVDSSVVNSSITDGNESNGNQVSFSGSAGISLDGLQKLLTTDEIAALTAPEPSESADPTADSDTTGEVN